MDHFQVVKGLTPLDYLLQKLLRDSLGESLVDLKQASECAAIGELLNQVEIVFGLDKFVNPYYVLAFNTLHDRYFSNQTFPALFGLLNVVGRYLFTRVGAFFLARRRNVLNFKHCSCGAFAQLMPKMVLASKCFAFKDSHFKFKIFNKP